MHAMSAALLLHAVVLHAMLAPLPITIACHASNFIYRYACMDCRNFAVVLHVMQCRRLTGICP